jgi:hypothetical protein
MITVITVVMITFALVMITEAADAQPSKPRRRGGAGGLRDQALADRTTEADDAVPRRKATSAFPPVPAVGGRSGPYRSAHQGRRLEGGGASQLFGHLPDHGVEIFLDAQILRDHVARCCRGGGNSCRASRTVARPPMPMMNLPTAARNTSSRLMSERLRRPEQSGSLPRLLPCRSDVDHGSSGPTTDHMHGSEQEVHLLSASDCGERIE